MTASPTIAQARAKRHRGDALLERLCAAAGMTVDATTVPDATSFGSLDELAAEADRLTELENAR